MTQDRGEEKGSQVDQSTLTQEEQVVPTWPRIASGFSRVLPHSYGMVLPEGSPSEGWVQPEDFLVKAPQEQKAFVCLVLLQPGLQSSGGSDPSRLSSLLVNGVRCAEKQLLPAFSE